MKTQKLSYKAAFEALTGGPKAETQEGHDRNFIATLLLDAVEQSWAPHDYGARRWLRGTYAQVLFMLLDISPNAALEALSKKWARIDADAPAPGGRLH